MPADRRLLTTPMCEVDARGVIVECRILTRTDLSDEAGALSARQLATLLTGTVLAETSTYVGIVIDVRQAPPVLGPQTRRSLETWLGLAERRSRRVAIVVLDTLEQRIQYGEVAEGRAPTRAKVFVDPELASRWATVGA